MKDLRTPGMLVFLFLLLFVPAGTIHGGEFPEAYSQAIDQLTRGEFVEGLKKYYRLSIFSDSLLSAEIRKRDLEKARNYFLEKIRTDPKDKKSVLWLALIDRITFDLVSANNRLNPLRENYPRVSLFRFLKGEFLICQGLMDQGQEVFAPLFLSPDEKKWSDMAKMILDKYGLGEKADKELKKKALLREAFNHMDAMEMEEARGLFLRIFAEFPDGSEAPKALVNLYLELKKPDEAEKIVETWNSKSSQPLLEPLQMARLNYSLGKFKETIALTREMSRKDPSNEYAKWLLAESYFQSGDYASSLPLYKEFYEKSPENIGMLDRYALCLENQNKMKELVGVYREALKKNPQNGYVRFQLLFCLITLDETEEAEKHFKQLEKDGSPYFKLASERIMEIERQRAENEEPQMTQNENSPDGAAPSSENSDTATSPTEAFFRAGKGHAASSSGEGGENQGKKPMEDLKALTTAYE